jgi:hypothetical protein
MDQMRMNQFKNEGSNEVVPEEPGKMGYNSHE